MSFSVTSRYYNLDTLTLTDSEGRTYPYVERRFLPQQDRFTTIAEHVVKENERLDNITAAYLGDPEQNWHICDANAAMRPAELVEEPGWRLRITLPEGIPGMPNHV